MTLSSEAYKRYLGYPNPHREYFFIGEALLPNKRFLLISGAILATLGLFVLLSKPAEIIKEVTQETVNPLLPFGAYNGPPLSD